jgi:hypothetical protein
VDALGNLVRFLLLPGQAHEQLRDDEFPPADMPITDLNIDVAKRDQFSWS